MFSPLDTPTYYRPDMKMTPWARRTGNKCRDCGAALKPVGLTQVGRRSFVRLVAVSVFGLVSALGMRVERRLWLLVSDSDGSLDIVRGDNDDCLAVPDLEAVEADSVRHSWP